jgi:hypothetical protein
MADISATQAFTFVADAAYLSRRPPPTAPDGYYDWQVTSDPAEKREGHSTVTNLVNRVSRSNLSRDTSLILLLGPNVPSKGGFKPDLKEVVCAVLVCYCTHRLDYV